MPRLTWSSALLLSGFAATAHAATGYPTELKLTHPDQRRIVEMAGKTLEAMQQACPVSMLNASPSTEERNISERLVRQEDEVVIEVDAELMNVPVGKEHKTLPVTYRCEFRDGRMIWGVWARGMVGEWGWFQGTALNEANLGTPFPD